MAKESKISWTHGTFNPWWGCTKVSPACDACYAERDSARFAPGLWGKDAPRRFFGDKHWDEPLRWNAAAQKSGQQFRVFCASMADVFEDRRDLDAPRERLWDLIERTPALTWLVLTKRANLMTKLAPSRWAASWPRNVWAMTTVEDQKRASQRIPHLLEVPAIVRGLSVEPMVGPVTVAQYLQGTLIPGINWVIAGGESGPTSRPTHPKWLRTLRDECGRMKVAYHIKQWGEWAPRGRLHDGDMLPVDNERTIIFNEDGNTRGRAAGSLTNLLSEFSDGSHCEVMERIGKKAAGRTLDGVIWDQYPL